MVASLGKIITSKTTTPMTTANGAAPIKMSLSVIDLFCRLLLTTKTEIPNGGVNNPISTVITVMIPNQIKSTPSGLSSGKKRGTVIKIIDIESMMVPNIKIIIKNVAITPIKFK